MKGKRRGYHNWLYRQRHREKHQARMAVYEAVRDGRMTRGPCEVCGTTEDVHGHHDDYSKRLEVRWICRSCHHDLHHPPPSMVEKRCGTCQQVKPLDEFHRRRRSRDGRMTRCKECDRQYQRDRAKRAAA